MSDPDLKGFIRGQFDTLCRGNTYATTLHLISSCVIKLGRITTLVPRPLFNSLDEVQMAKELHATLKEITFTMKDGEEKKAKRVQPSPAQRRAATKVTIAPSGLPAASSGRAAAERRADASRPSKYAPPETPLSSHELLKVSVGENEDAYFRNEGPPRHGRLFRGMSRGNLPPSFWKANAFNVRGGTEFAFMSSTPNEEVAKHYALGSTNSMCFEIQQGMIARGADISWLSQYPHEEEVLWPPFTALEVVSERVDGGVLFIGLDPSLPCGKEHSPQASDLHAPGLPAAAAEPAAAAADFAIDLTTGLQSSADKVSAWHVRSDSGGGEEKAMVTTHLGNGWHAPTVGQWLDGGQGTYRKVFLVRFELTEAQAAAAELALAYAVDNTLEKAILNQQKISIGSQQASGFGECGGTQVVRAARGAGLFQKSNLLELHMHNAGGPGGLYALGKVRGIASAAAPRADAERPVRQPWVDLRPRMEDRGGEGRGGEVVSYGEAVEHDGRLLMVGKGEEEQRDRKAGVKAAVLESTDEGTTWRLVGPPVFFAGMSEVGRLVSHEGTLLLVGGKLYGHKHEKDPRGSVWRSDDHGRNWSRHDDRCRPFAKERGVSGDRQLGRDHFALLSHGGDVMVVGGRSKHAQYAVVERSADEATSWARVLEEEPLEANTIWSHRAAHGAVASFAGYVYLVGGGVPTREGARPPGSGPCSDVWRSRSGKSGDWECVVSQATGINLEGKQVPFLEHRVGHRVAALKSWLYVVGGEKDGMPFTDMWRSLDGESWEEVDLQASLQPRVGGTLVASEARGCLLLIGGQRKGGSAPAGVWRWSPDGTVARSTPAPTPIPESRPSEGGGGGVSSGPGQWCARVVAFSSQRDAEAHSAAQLVGKPKVYPNQGADVPGAWRAKSKGAERLAREGEHEWVELEFEAAVVATGLEIYETFAPGTVVRVCLRDPSGGWDTVWQGVPAHAAAPPEAPRVFSPQLARKPYPTSAVRLQLAPHGQLGCGAIDAVRLLGEVQRAPAPAREIAVRPAASHVVEPLPEAPHAPVYRPRSPEAAEPYEPM